jgi:hypothetical protein
MEMAIDPTLHEQEWDIQIVAVFESDAYPEWDRVSHLATDGRVLGFIPRSERAMRFLSDGNLPAKMGKVAFVEWGDRSNTAGVMYVASVATEEGLRVIHTDWHGHIIMATVLAPPD